MKTILIIEDDADIRQTLALLLQDQGYQVYEAENGSVALALLEDIPHPCIILLDLFMPIMDGVEFLSLLRVIPNRVIATLPVVVVSAAPPDGEIVKTAVQNASGFIKKPFELDGLLAMIRQYC